MSDKNQHPRVDEIRARLASAGMLVPRRDEIEAISNRTRADIAWLLEALDDEYMVAEDRRSTAASLEAEVATLREDRERLDWMQANKGGGGRGGWEVKPPESGWTLQIVPRGPYHSLRQAIDAARQASSSQPIVKASVANLEPKT